MRWHFLETAASDPEKGNEMSFIWLNQWQNIIFFPFSQGGRRANKWSLKHKGHMVHSVSSWEQGRAGTRIWSQRFHHLNCLVILIYFLIFYIILILIGILILNYFFLERPILLQFLFLRSQ